MRKDGERERSGWMWTRERVARDCGDEDGDGEDQQKVCEWEEEGGKDKKGGTRRWFGQKSEEKTWFDERVAHVFLFSFLQSGDQSE